jgi:hypothetical protein
MPIPEGWNALLSMKCCLKSWNISELFEPYLLTFSSATIMSSFAFDIQFDYFIQKGGVAVHLIADVEEHASDRTYLIKNIRTFNSLRRSVIPNIRIKRKGGAWVHVDSEKETDLSMAAGTAIDRIFCSV